MTREALPDANALARIHALCFPHAPWKAKAFSGLMQQSGVFWVLSKNQDAFVFVSYAPPEADILTLAVHPDSRRKGEARRLLQSVIALCPSLKIEELYLEVGASNAAARALYAQAGFDEVGLRKAYYATPDGTREDAVILKRVILPQNRLT